MGENNTFGVTETTSWFSRIKNAFFGIVIGIIIFIGSIFWLTWNEKRSVEIYNTLTEGQKLVHSIASTEVNPNNNNKLVHLTGFATTKETLIDPIFNISQNVIQLKREVSMYQWKENIKSETEHNTGGSTSTHRTYTYAKGWSSTPIDSSRFKQQADHQNPTSWLYTSNLWQARVVNVGAFVLSQDQIAGMDSYQSLPVSVDNLPESLKSQMKPFNGGYYLGDDPLQSKVGDLKIQYSIVKSNDITLIAKQIGNTFEPFHTHAGGTISMLETGKHSIQYMFTKAFEKNELITWWYRIGGMMLMWMGLSLLFRPIAVFADFLPLLGVIANTGIGFITFLLALTISFTVIGIAWIAIHPLVGSLVVAAGLGLLIAGILFKKRIKN